MVGSFLLVAYRIGRGLGGGVVFCGVVDRGKCTLRWSKLAGSRMMWVVGG